MDGSRRSDAMDGSRRSDAMDGSRRSDAMDGLRESRRSWGMSDNDGGMRGSSRGLAPSDSDGMRGGSEWLNSGTSGSWSGRDNWKSELTRWESEAEYLCFNTEKMEMGNVHSGNLALPVGMMSGDYERSSLGSSRSYMEPIPSRSERFGPYESHDSRSALDGHDLYRSGYDLHEPGRSRFGDSYPDRSENSYRNFGDQYLDPYEGRSQSRLYDKSRSSWDDSYSHSSSMPRVWADSDTGRGSYSSYSSFSTLLSKPSSGGSRGRGTLAYSGTEYGGGPYSMMGGQGGGRGRGREQSDLDMYSRPLIQIDTSYQPYKRGGFASNFGRGMKRKGIQPNKAAVKKQKLASAEKVLKAPAAKAPNQANARIKMTLLSTGQDPEKDEDFTKDAYDPDAYECFEGKKKTDTEDEEEKKKLEARREKQRRRREKNTEKYGEDYRNAFTCSLCKFRTTEELEIEAHLETPYHKETLEFIGKNILFEKGAADFLHASMVNKNKKIAARKQFQQQEQRDPAQKLSKDVLMGVSSDDQMKKVEAVQCAVCNTYIPFLFHSVQQHLKSNEHINSKKNYHDQVRRESLLTASSMLNNPTVKAKFDLYLKGENPFENPQELQQQEQQQSEELEQEPEHEEDNEEGNEEENQEEEERQADEADDQAPEKEENQAEMEDVPCEPADP
ncbi:DBIRD complex subunit ZNF326 isoform X4 [Amblyraja radiata]|uniref:DBIRD complex subunit ZNF326 isoform X4 n=1 Tax=Amblyraja radiata TaxID=386614 RepID=UPI0014020C94|nr:DBIRD complex subunit ZNF326 isoform X4 [Amblyraja radiata]